MTALYSTPKPQCWQPFPVTFKFGRSENELFNLPVVSVRVKRGRLSEPDRSQEGLDIQKH